MELSFENASVIDQVQGVGPAMANILLTMGKN